MKKILAYLVVFTGLIVVVGGLAGLKITQFSLMGQASPQMPPETVTAATVKQETWEPTLDTVGSLAAYQGVVVTTEASGIVSQVTFEAGSKVQAGDLLLKLDTSVLEAQLDASQSRAALAKINADRARELLARNSISQADVDTSEAQLKQALADTSYTRALIAQKQVRAPFSGRLGIRQINIGQYIDRGNPIVSLQSLDPIYVNFNLPQQQLAQLSIGLKVRITIDAMPGRKFEGTITAVNPEVDSATRNVRVQATFSNTDEKLRPGMFVGVSVVLPQSEEVIIAPVTSILYAPYSDSVFVITEGKTLRQQFVRLGRIQGDYVVVLKGLKPGEQVVSSGVFKLRNGMSVTIDNTLSPVFSTNPKPVNE